MSLTSTETRFNGPHFYLNVTTLSSALCCHKSVCRLSSVTLVHPTQGVEAFGNISSPLSRCARWPSSDLRAKFYGDRPRETPPSGALNATGVSKKRFWTYRRLYLINSTT